MDLSDGQGYSFATSVLAPRYIDVEVGAETDDSDNDLGDNIDPLLIAVKNKNLLAVEHLMELQTNVNFPDYKGWTPLHHAARVGHFKIMKCLLESGAKADAQNNSFETPLYLAAWQGRSDCLQELINKLKEREGGESEIINLQAKNQKTPLMIAAQHGHKACMEILLENNADTELMTDSNMTALHLAIQGDHVECLDVLASKMNLRPYIESCHPESIGCRDDVKYDMVSPMYVAVQWKSYGCLKRLLSLGFSPDSVHERTDLPTLFLSPADFGLYESAVSFAVQKEDKQALSILFASGATCGTNYIGACHPLVRALDLPRTDMLDLLLERGDNCSFGRHFFERSSVLLSSIVKPYRTKNLLLYGCDAKLGFEIEMTRTLSILAPFVMSDHKKLVKKMELFLQFSVVNSCVQKACHEIIDRERSKKEFTETMWQGIFTTISQPSPLKHICRMKIRHQLYDKYGPSFVRRLHSMPLPPSLKAYVSFDIIAVPP